MERYGTHCEQTYRTNFNRGRAKCIDWVIQAFNIIREEGYLYVDKTDIIWDLANKGTTFFRFHQIFP